MLCHENFYRLSIHDDFSPVLAFISKNGKVLLSRSVLNCVVTKESVRLVFNSKELRLKQLNSVLMSMNRKRRSKMPSIQLITILVFVFSVKIVPNFNGIAAARVVIDLFDLVSLAFIQVKDVFDLPSSFSWTRQEVLLNRNQVVFKQ